MTAISGIDISNDAILILSLILATLHIKASADLQIGLSVIFFGSQISVRRIVGVDWRHIV